MVIVILEEKKGFHYLKKSSSEQFKFIEVKDASDIVLTQDNHVVVGIINGERDCSSI